MLVERLIQLARRIALMLKQVDQDAGIKRTGTAAHRQDLQRTKAHRRVDAPALANGRQRAAIAQVTDDEPQRSQVAPQEIGGALGAILVVDPVKAIPPDAALVPFIEAR